MSSARRPTTAAKAFLGRWIRRLCLPIFFLGFCLMALIRVLVFGLLAVRDWIRKPFRRKPAATAPGTDAGDSTRSCVALPGRNGRLRSADCGLRN